MLLNDAIPMIDWPRQASALLSTVEDAECRVLLRGDFDNSIGYIDDGHPPQWAGRMAFQMLKIGVRNYHELVQEFLDV